MRLAVYTAIFGAYDDLMDQPVQVGVDADWLCFTDDPSLRSTTWRIVHTARRFDHPTKDARFPKLLPHLFLGCYDLSVYLDGSVEFLRSDALARLLRDLGDSPMGAIPHPERSDISKEAQAIERIPRHQGQPIWQQVCHYLSAGLPPDHGLYAGTILVRRHWNPLVQAFDSLWMREFLRWSLRDQLSLPYALWRVGLTPARIPIYLWDNPWFRVHRHRADG